MQFIPIRAGSIIPVLCLFMVFVSSLAMAADQDLTPDAAMLRYPDVGHKHIVFVFANDLWVVDKQGGLARPLASPAGVESFPKISRDGQTIAFVGNYDGNRDLYTVPVNGGVPFRVTHHPAAEFLCDFTAQGNLLYYSKANVALDSSFKIFTVSQEGGLPKELPIQYGAACALSPDGEILAYTPTNRDFATWKRYCGGTASNLWLFNLKTFKSKQITTWKGMDSLPMWGKDKVYYLSDQGESHKLNIWAYDLKKETNRQVTFFKDYDVKWPSIGPQEIVFQKGPGLYLLDLDSEKSREVKVAVPGARSFLRHKTIDAGKFIHNWAFSATGKRVLVQARGDIWTLPAEKGAPRNLTRTSGIGERDAAWSPDGKWIAYFSDATGEYELYITQSDGKGETQQITRNSRTFYFNPIWAPDSKSLLISDKAGKLFVCNVETKEVQLADTDPWHAHMGRVASWSHDSKWITFSRAAKDASFPSIFIYGLEDKTLTKVTSGYHGEFSPVFDREGDHLFFQSNRIYTPTNSSVSQNYVYKETSLIFAAPLRGDMKWPWPLESDEETWDKEEKKEEDKKKEEEAKPADDGISGLWEGTAITPEGELPFTFTLEMKPDNSVTGSLSSQMYTGQFTGTYNKEKGVITGVIEMDQGFQVNLTVTIEGSSMKGEGRTDTDTITIVAERASGAEDKEKKEKKKKKAVEIDFKGFEDRIFALPIPKGDFTRLGVNDKNQLIYGRQGKGIKLFDLKDKTKSEKTVTKSSSMFGMSGDGRKLLLFSGGKVSIADAKAGAAAKTVSTENMKVQINPREEWRQLFSDTWRLYRDFFYLENLHEVDWDKTRERYEPMLTLCMSREEVSYVISEMISELNVGHAYYRGGDEERPESVAVGMLGVDFEVKENAFAFKKIYKAPNVQSPLAKLNLGVKEGDFLLAVNGVPMDMKKDPWAAFCGLANKTVVLTISEKPRMDETAKDIVVKTMSSETNLRYRAWVEANRRFVAEKTDGQVGYLHVPDTAWDGRNSFMSQYLGQTMKKALIVDERWNKGGYDPIPMIDMMNRPINSFWASRHGQDDASPGGAHQGPKCMLINSFAGSGGDMFPWQFRFYNLGKLIGMRTWGGLVGLSGNPRLIDGGRPSIPNVAFYEIDGTWGVEGHGVDPDIEVIDDPALMLNGADPQLNRAIDLMLEQIKTFDYIKPNRPAPPDRSGMGIPKEDW